MADNKQHDTRTARRPDCVTEIRMGNSVLVVSGYFKKDTTTTAADKMARVLEAGVLQLPQTQQLGSAVPKQRGGMATKREGDFVWMYVSAQKRSNI